MVASLALSLALPLSQWLQQYCVEQCAVLLALSERMPTFTSDDDLPCHLGRADGYEGTAALHGLRALVDGARRCVLERPALPV